MHIAFALFRYFPFGGMQRDMLAIAQRMRTRGHQVTIYCHTWQGERPTDLDVRVLEIGGHTNHTRARRFNRALQSQLASQHHDLVLGFDKLEGLDAYFAADPCYVTRTADRRWPYRLTPRYRTFRALECGVFGAGGAKKILMLDEREQPNYQRTWNTDGARFVALPPGIAPDRRRGPDAAALRESGRAEFGVGDGDFLVLLLAANFELKGLDRAIRAVAALPPEQRSRTHLLAVGQSPPRPLRQLADDLLTGEQVAMLPGRTDIPRLLQSADLLIHPARRDTTATVLLEAVAAELPVLCTDACGYASHIAAAGCGRVIPEPFAQAALDQHLREMLSADLSDLRQKAHAYGQQRDLHGMHDYVCDLLPSLAQGSCDDPAAGATSMS